MRNIWNLRKSVGPTATTRRPVEDPAAMTSEIKSRARALGAGLVGVTRIKPGYVYQGHEVPYRNAIAIGVVMDRGKMKEVPGVVSGTEVMRIYAEVGRIASQLSEEIRAMGWPARAYGNPNSGDLLHIPISVDAGFGQLGKHGSLISREYGSNFRLGTIVTDLPLQADQPVDIAVDDLARGAISASASVRWMRSTTKSSWYAASRSGTWTSTNAFTISPRPPAAGFASRCAPGVRREADLGCRRSYSLRGRRPRRRRHLQETELARSGFRARSNARTPMVPAFFSHG